MRTSRSVSFPQPKSSDFEDVHWALTAGKSLWEQGERTEALKWLRRAANTAADHDADVRAVELFKAAADLVEVAGAPDDGVAEDETPTLDSNKHHAQHPAPRVGAPAHPPKRERPASSRRVPRPPMRAAPRPTLPGTTAPRQRANTPKQPPRPRRRLGTRPDPRPPQSSGEPRDLSPRVPPATRISERFGAFELPFDDTEEDTFIRPDTMLRRALEAIDPEYKARTEYYDDGDGPRPRFVGDFADEDEEDEEDDKAPSRSPAGWGWDDEESHDGEPDDDDDLQEETQRRIRPDALSDLSAPTPVQPPVEEPAPRAKTPSHTAGPMPGGLLTLRVAVLPIPEEGDIRIIFLSPDEDPPPGVATALLVPPSEQDARLLAEVYADADAKV